MTNEQCIKVVNLWGWYKTPQGWYDGDIKIDHLNYTMDEHDWIKRKVNSWEGFGRTVEAMDAKRWYFNKSTEGIYFYRWLGTRKDTTMSRDQGPTTGSLITATHLSALEALSD